MDCRDSRQFPRGSNYLQCCRGLRAFGAPPGLRQRGDIAEAIRCLRVAAEKENWIRWALRRLPSNRRPGSRPTRSHCLRNSPVLIGEHPFHGFRRGDHQQCRQSL